MLKQSLSTSRLEQSRYPVDMISPSQEFALKGAYAFRFYKVSFGTNPNSRDFTRDSQRVTGQTSAEVFAFLATTPLAAETRETSAYGEQSSAT